MSVFSSNGIEIYYEQHGAGQPIVLVHGFASNGKINWLNTGWVKDLTQKGFAPVILDNRGHGNSQKLYDSAYYPAREMAKDVAALINHLGLDQAPIMGYSMGARISAFVALDHPQVVSSVIFGGLGINMVRGLGNSEDIVSGLLAPTLDEVETDIGRMFRMFAERTGGDLRALAACMGASRDRITGDELSKLDLPVLVAVGSEDEIGGDPHELAQLIAGAQSVHIPNRDHMRATGDRFFKQAVLDFLAKKSS